MSTTTSACFLQQPLERLALVAPAEELLFRPPRDHGRSDHTALTDPSRLLGASWFGLRDYGFP